MFVMFHKPAQINHMSRSNTEITIYITCYDDSAFCKNFSHIYLVLTIITLKFVKNIIMVL